MKANELMVGDLVLHDGKVIRVDAVHKRKIGYHKTKDKLTWLFDGQFQPIPLTHEILGKNGFVKGDTMDLGDEIYCVELFNIHYDNEERRFWVCNFFESEYGTWEIMDIFRIDYVHELQHALRLCKIEKEIVL
jgi:hypothetical protein